MTSDDAEAVRRGLKEAFALIGEGRYGLAVPALEALAAAHPSNPEAQHVCGATLAHLAQPERALPYLRQALALRPGDGRTQLALGLALLALGRYREGWPLAAGHEELRGLKAKPSLPFPEWRGEPLKGRRLLVWPEEGHGDQIQFARFARALRDQGAEVVFCCWRPLVTLFERNLPAQVCELRGGLQVETPDFWTTAALLPMHLGVTLETIPNEPYLAAPETRRTPGGRIGLVARGNPGHNNDAHRSLPPPLAQRLLELPGAISLHPDDTGAADFAETASIIAGLDLVISVDTAVAHLAGAMGKPVWILLPTIGLDWRWGTEGERSAWYPSARLFRQPRISDWPAVVEQVIGALKQSGLVG